MQFLQTRSKKSGVLVVLLAVTIAAIVAFLPNRILPAHADDSFCQSQGGVTYKMAFADGYANNPVTLSNTGVGSSSLRVTLNAYQITGNSDNNHYMLFRVTVTLDPASFQNRVASKPVFGFSAPPDTSPDGERSTLQVRLWSTNARTTPCPTSSCIQSGGVSL